MEKIRNYVKRFFKSKKRNDIYCMKAVEMVSFLDEIRGGSDMNSGYDLVTTLFDYGYAKGYRACQAEMKKMQEV